MSHQITPEMQAKIREQGLGQVIVALARMMLDLHPDPPGARARFNLVIDELIDGYDFRDQPHEVVSAARDLMRAHVDNLISQVVDHR